MCGSDFNKTHQDGSTRPIGWLLQGFMRINQTILHEGRKVGQGEKFYGPKKIGAL